ncbi:MAG: SDR family NAD(P)-dependent oxidoreductase [Planctomycetota bacterium]
MDKLEILCALSREVGADPDLVLAGGGNTSVKTADTLWVKASGTALATLVPEGLVALDRARLSAALLRRYSDDPLHREDEIKRELLGARRESGGDRRPSVEALLHHLLERPFVVHVHPWRLNAIACAATGEAIVRELWGGRVIWVPYCNPGYLLATAVRDRVAAAKPDGTKPIIVILQNHGLFIATRDADEARATLRDILGRVDAFLESRGLRSEFKAGKTVTPVRPQREDLLAVAPALRGALAGDGPGPVVRLLDDPLARAFLDSPDGKCLALSGPITPDHIVYCNSLPLWCDPAGKSGESLAGSVAAAAKAALANEKGTPRVILVPGVGAWTTGAASADAVTAGAVFVDALKTIALAEGLGGCRFLSVEERGFIESWEAEHYRRKAGSAGRAGRVAGRVAVVTGAAQGFGGGIARALAAEGAFVCVADLNAAGARAAAEEICRAAGAGRAVAVEVNVADAGSAAAMAEAVVREFGGCDILISNAGILRAGSVTELSAEDFRRVTDVNYTGYFLAVKSIAPVMAAQHRANSDSVADIIQVNSKSGLQGSNRNAAYAGSKFGGVGLTQSFALELLADGVKVNAVCPGNFFDGPLWSDPQNGLFVQYLKSGKVPGAKTVGDVRRFYESKVPMGRGCRVEDVMTAIYYLIDQKYETGQALPVTGGQVMR